MEEVIVTTKEKELFEKKVTIKDWLVIKLCNILNLPKNYTGTKRQAYENGTP